MAPELLPYQSALVEEIYKLVNKKDREISSRAEKRQKGQSRGDERFYLNIMRMEMERVKYLIKSYLRTRIIKIERFLNYIIEKDQFKLLSEGEANYAFTLYEAKKDHFTS